MDTGNTTHERDRLRIITHRERSTGKFRTLKNQTFTVVTDDLEIVEDWTSNDEIEITVGHSPESVTVRNFACDNTVRATLDLASS
jgi:hypothetical protein